MKIFISILIFCSVISAETSWKSQATLSASIITFWTASGIVEGLKFSGRQDMTFAGLDYHSWRAIENASIVSSPLLAIHCGGNKQTYKNLIISNLVGWILYERMISVLNQKEFFGHHGDFHIQNAVIKRPSPILESFLALSLSVGVYYTF